MTRHIADRAGFLASLSKNDPERRAAEDHAIACGTCREALEEGARLMSLLREAVPVAGPTPAVLAHAAEAIGREIHDERRTARRFRLLVAGAVGLAWLFQLMVGSGFVMQARQLAGSLAALGAAIASVTLLRGRERWALPTIVATSGVFAFLAATSTGLDAGIGIRCSFREIWAAGVTWVVVLLAGRRWGVALDRWNLAGVAAAGALAAHAGQHIACEVPHSDAHVFAFHFSVVLVVAAIGAISAAIPPLGRGSARPAP
jgi:hypothetical protein